MEELKVMESVYKNKIETHHRKERYERSEVRRKAQQTDDD